MNKLEIRVTQLYEKYKDYTMIPDYYYKANSKLAFDRRNIEGAVVECGTWKGGMIAGIAELLGNDRTYHLFDSFEGLPPAQPIDGQTAKDWQADKEGEQYYDNCTAALEDAQKAMSLVRATNVHYHKGWFQDTVPDFKIEEGISVLRLDGDWYESTMICLNNFFDQVNDGGLILIDDYYTWEGCAKAIHEFLYKNDRVERIQVFEGVVYLVKNQSFTFES